MPRGGKRPGQGRPEGNPKRIKRIVTKAVRFTPNEWRQVKTTIEKYGGRETDFIRDAVIEKANH